MAKKKSVKTSKNQTSDSKFLIKTFGVIGILLIVVSLGYFVKYAFDQGWIGYLGRIIIGCIVGICITVGGYILLKKKNKYSILSQIIIGGGIAIVYISTYSAYVYEPAKAEIGTTFLAEVILLSIITIVTILFAIKENSKLILSVSFFLGYITSLLTDTEALVASANFKLIYLLIITAAILGVTIYKKWTGFALFSVITTTIGFLIWMIRHEADIKVLNTSYFGFLTAYLILFLTFNFITEFKKANQLQKGINHAVHILASLFFFFFMYIRIYNHYQKYLTLFCFVIAAIYLIIGMVLKKKQSLYHSSWALFTLFTLIALSRLHAEWKTISIAIFVLALAGLYIYSKQTIFRISAYIVSAYLTLKVFLYDIWFLEKKQQILGWVVNCPRLRCLLAISLSFLLMVYLIKNQFPKLKEKLTIATIYLCMALFSFLALISFELKLKPYWIVVLYTLTSSILLVIALRKRQVDLRIASYFIGSFIFLKILLYDSFTMTFGIERLSTFLFFSLNFIIASYTLSTRKIKEAKVFEVIYACFAYTIILITIALEMYSYWITIFWALLAISILITGFIINKKYLRVIGTIILTITVLKVFLYDIWKLNALYKIITTLIVGLLTLFIAYIYIRLEKNIKNNKKANTKWLHSYIPIIIVVVLIIFGIYIEMTSKAVYMDIKYVIPEYQYSDEYKLEYDQSLVEQIDSDIPELIEKQHSGTRNLYIKFKEEDYSSKAVYASKTLPKTTKEEFVLKADGAYFLTDRKLTEVQYIIDNIAYNRKIDLNSDQNTSNDQIIYLDFQYNNHYIIDNKEFFEGEIITINHKSFPNRNYYNNQTNYTIKNLKTGELLNDLVYQKNYKEKLGDIVIIEHYDTNKRYRIEYNPGIKAKVISQDETKNLTSIDYEHDEIKEPDERLKYMIEIGDIDYAVLKVDKLARSKIIAICSKSVCTEEFE